MFSIKSSTKCTIKIAECHILKHVDISYKWNGKKSFFHYKTAAVAKSRKDIS